MTTSKRVLRIGLVAVMGLAFLSACHFVQGSSKGSYKLRWVNATDSRNVLEVTLQDPTVMAQLKMAVHGRNVGGTYVLREGDKTTEGKVKQLDDSYWLISQDGKEQRLAVERETGSLKDENGKIWKVDNPTTSATLKEW